MTESARTIARRPDGNGPQNRSRTGDRGTDGRFLPGTSANPGGRPKAEYRVIDLAREHTEFAIETLAAIARDKDAPASARVAACAHLLDRAWGKPRQALELSSEESTPTSLVVTYVNGQGQLVGNDGVLMRDADGNVLMDREIERRMQARSAAGVPGGLPVAS